MHSISLPSWTSLTDLIVVGGVKGRVGEGLVVKLHQIVVHVNGEADTYSNPKTIVTAQTDKKFAMVCPWCIQLLAASNDYSCQEKT